MSSSAPLAFLVVSAILGAGPAYGQAVNLGGAVNNIVPDGRTKTNVTVNGDHTKITTDTVSNNTGFNSFSDFQQAAGKRVDLFVPDGAGNLVNIVRNGAVIIDGELNAFKDGEIGGNIFFSDSHGFIVGKNGSVNVGSLTVNTPTSEFLESVIGTDGRVNNAMADRLMRGEIPLSADGVIAISGMINAKGGITLQGNTVTVNGRTVQVNGTDLDQRTKFESTVNTTGLIEGGALVSRGGVISIVAKGNVRLGGTVDVSAQTSGAGGTVSIRSDADIAIESTARLAADGYGATGKGGDIVVVASEAIDVADQAVFTARGAGVGTGGFVELSGKLATIGAIRVDLGSDAGSAGTLLFDPIDLVFGGAGGGDVFSLGANVVLQADNSITLSAGGIIDTRLQAAGISTGNSGNVTLQAPNITIGDGASVLAGVSPASAFAAGNILFDAQQLQGGAASITIGAGSTITGGNVTFTANVLINQAALLRATPTAHATVTITSANIIASGALVATATATSNGGIADLPIGKVDTDVQASVTIAGASIINAASAKLSAVANAQSKVATQSLLSNQASQDLAVAISNVTSTATSQVRGTSKLTVAGVLEILSSNSVVNTVDATPFVAENGASVAASKIIASSSANVAEAAEISAGGLTLGASMSTTTIAKAVAGAGGATEAAPGTVAATYLADHNKEASTSQGEATKAASLAISDVTATSTASMTSSKKATIGALSVSTTTVNTANVSADSSPLERKDAKGVAIAINNAKIQNNANIGQSVDAASATVSALMNGVGAKNNFDTTATSGAGGEDVGIAGSIASNKIDTQSAASVGAAAVVTLAGGDLGISSENNTISTAKALPGTAPTAGADKGVGASFVRNIVANRSYTDLVNGASVLGARNVSLTASAENAVETEAHGGASGGTAIVPLVAVSLVNNSTHAILGTGSLLQTTGDVTLGATQQASTTTKAIGDQALGDKASGGLSVSVAVVNDDVAATTNRAITAGGNVGFVAMGASVSAVLAQASVTGGRAADTNGNAAPGQPADVDASVTTEVESAQTAQAAGGVGDASQQQATDESVNGTDAQSGRSSAVSGGKIAVAAAVGVNVQKSKTTASVVDGNNITATGGLGLRALNNTDGSVITDGNALGTAGAVDPEYSVGATVAVNHVRVSNDATLGNGTHAAAAISIEALKLDIAKLLANPASTDTHTDTFLTQAASGAGGARIGAAGAVALNMLDTQSTASLAGGAIVNLTGGNLAISTDNRNSVTAEAKPGAPTAFGAEGGLGASAAVNVVANRSYAEIRDGATVTGAKNIGLLANGESHATADALAGASAGKYAGVPVLALSLINNSTTAQIGAGAPLVAIGKIDIIATQSATETTIAKGGVSAEKAAIGMSLALSLINDHALATTKRSLQANGDITIAASGVSTAVLSSIAGAKGGRPADDDGNPAAGESNVDDSVTAQFNAWRKRQQDAIMGDAGQRTYTASAATTDHSAATAEGKFAGAAAAAVNVARTSVTASADNGTAGLNISSGGRLTLSSTALTNGSPTADAMVASVESGASAAAAVNAVKASNFAVLGKGTHVANGLSIIASKGPNPAALPVDTFATVATSGAGNSKIGVAGALALNLITADTIAEITAGATVNAGTGTSFVQAFERLNGTASATPIDAGGAGGDYGVGASVALNILNTTTRAEIANGASYQNGTALTVQANSDIATTTTAAAGAEGGVAVDAVLALASLNLNTTARIGSGAAMTTTGAVWLDAALTGANIANAKGTNNSDKYGAGASAALILGGGTRTGALVNTSNTSAVLARDLIAPALRISASSTRSYDATATATAGGGEFSQVDETRNDTTGGEVNSASTLQDTAADQEGLASGNKISVAAAAGVVAAKDVVTASVSGVTLNIAGALAVDAANKIDMATKGSGEAVNITGKYGVSVGVGLGIIHNQTLAEIGNGTHVIHAGSTTVTATTSENASAPFLHRLTAEALSGASAEKAAVAGAFALAISEAESTAVIGDGVTIDNGGAVIVGLDNTSKLSAKAWAGAALRGKYGVGASVATVVARNAFNAGIGADSSINAASLSVTAINRKVNEPTTHVFTNFGAFETSLLDQSLLGATNYYAEAIAGAVAGAGAAEGSFAVMKFEDVVNVSIGRSLTSNAVTKSTINALAGAVTMSASTDFTAKSVAGGIALGRNDGVGISSADIANRTVTSARLAANAVINAASFGASAVAVADIQTYGVTAAAGNRAGIAGVDNTVVSENRVEALLDNLASVNTSGSVATTAENRLSAFSLAGAAAGSGTRIAVGATVAVLDVRNVTRAGISHGTALSPAARINSGGPVLIRALSTQNADAKVAAGAAAGKVAAGAGSVVYKFNVLTEALVGNFAGVGLTTPPASIDILASDATVLENYAGALSGGQTAGAGAGVVVADITKNTRALIGTNSHVTAGNIVAKADSSTDMTNMVAGVGLGQTAGAAGAVVVVDLNATTLAEVGTNAVIYSTGNVATLATALNQIDTVAGTGAIGGTAGVGASAVIVDVTANTDARIADGARVTALGNLPGQTYVLRYQPSFTAYDDNFKAPDIDPAKVTLVALPTAPAVTAENAKQNGMGLLTNKRLSTPVAGLAKGVIVNAASANQLRGLAASGAGGGTGAVALSAFVPIVVANTNANIGTGTRINQDAGVPNADQSVMVGAASDFYLLGGVGSIAGGGTVAGGAGLALAIVENNTRAAIGSGSILSAERDIAVTANAAEDFVLGAAAGSVGGTEALAGGASTIAMTNITSANLGGTSIAKGNVDVAAEDITRTALAAGGLGATGGVVFGASLGLVLMDKTTVASIGNAALVTALGLRGDHTTYTGGTFTETRLARGVNVFANSNQSIFTLASAGGVGLAAGVSGVVSLEMLTINTSASIGDNAAINTATGLPAAHAAQDVVVAARDSTASYVLDGGFAGGLYAGINGAVDVGVFRNNVAATIGDDATVKARRDVLVSALSNKAGTSTAVSGTFGAVAIAAGISIYNYGDGLAPGGASAQHINSASPGGATGLNSVTNMASAQINNGEVTQLLSTSSNDNVRSVSLNSQAKRTGIDLTPVTTTGTLAGVSSRIGNATITADGSVRVRSVDDLKVEITTGAIGAGGVGLGAGVGVATIETTNSANISSTSAVRAANLLVAATTNHALDGISFAGTGGLTFAAEADVAVLTDRSNTYATLAGGIITVSGDVAVNAYATRSAKAEAKGAAIGGGAAVGISYANAELAGRVEADMRQFGGQKTTIGSTGSRATTASIHARANDTASSDALTGAGGLGLAAQSGNAITFVAPVVTANVDGAQIFTTGLIKTRAEANGSVNAVARGIALAGGISSGGSFADARIASNVGSTISNGALLDAGSVDIKALLAPAAPFVNAFASGISGAFVGINATEANAVNLSQAHALFMGSAINAIGAVVIGAENKTRQTAEAWGLNGGIVAAGANIARANSNTQTTAMLVDHLGIAAGSLSLTATGSDSNTANATAGSGGIVAGSAAKAETSATSVTRAATETTIVPTIAVPAKVMSVLGGTVSIAALHTTNVAGYVDSTQASIAGASGATLVHNVNATVDAHLGKYAAVRAANLAISARNLTRNYFRGETSPGSIAPDAAAWSVNSGSGGLINLPAGSATVRISHATNASIGDDADIHLIAAGIGRSVLSLEAFNDIVSHQKSRLDSGGAIATAAAHVDIQIPSATATAFFGANSEIIVDFGDIKVAASGNANLDGRAAATTYGLAGAPTGLAYAVYNGLNTIDVGRNVRLEATDGSVTLATGYDLAGATSTMTLHTSVDLYNKTAIPLNGTPDARSNVANNSAITVQPDPAGGAKGIRAADTITLKATRGTMNTSAVGLGKDIYREILAKIASAISNLFGGDDVSFDTHGGSTSATGLGTVTVDGVIETGLARHQYLTVKYSDTDTAPNAYSTTTCYVATTACLAAPNSDEIKATITGPEDVGTEIVKRVAELRSLLEEYGGDPVAKGAYQNEIKFLEDKLVALGLGIYDGAGQFVAGQYAGESDKAKALKIVDGDQASISTTTNNLVGSTSVVFVPATLDPTAKIKADYHDAANGIKANSDSAWTVIQTLSGYDAVKADTTFVAVRDRVLANTNAGRDAATAVDTATAGVRAQQAIIDTQTKVIVDNRKAKADALYAGNTAAANAAQTNITNAQGAIKNALTQINLHNASLNTNRATAASAASDIRSDLEYLTAQARTSGNAGDNTKASNLVAGQFAKITTAASDLPTQSTTLGTHITTSSNRVTTLAAASTSPDSLDNFVKRLRDLTDSYVQHKQDADVASDTIKAPQTYTIEVADVVTRLGNISVAANRLVGAGELNAPGDASIKITNRTSNSLKIGNLGFTEGGGSIQFNGTLVTTNSEINALNAGGVGAAFRTIDSAGANPPPALVQIISEYNPDSLISYDDTSPLEHKKSRRVAPDIIINSGALISNPTGAVEIISNAGNIYNRGEINAKSVTIVAKNGDFVSSYVNGRYDVGGNPFLFANPAVPNPYNAERGPGILSNGAVSISARYLNINSVIQSGIPTWLLNIDANPVLYIPFDDAAKIGYSATEIADMRTLYAGLAPGVRAGTSMPAAHIYFTGDITYVEGGGVEGGADRLEFNLSVADEYRAQGGTGDLVYGIRNRYSKLAAAYDGRNNEIVVDGTNVRGGYIQIYGQIINTTPTPTPDPVTGYVGTGGELRVLDGFGTINISNASNIPVVLQSLNAGDDPQGNLRGTSGVIDITDVISVYNDPNPDFSVVEVKRTRYKRDYVPGSATGNVQVASFVGRIDNETGNVLDGSGNVATDASFIYAATGSDRLTAYNLTANQRLVQTSGTYYDMSTRFTKSGEQVDDDLQALTRDTASTVTIESEYYNNVRDIALGYYVTKDRTTVANPSIVQNVFNIAIPTTPLTKANDDPTLGAYEVATYNYFEDLSQDSKLSWGTFSNCAFYFLGCSGNRYAYSYTVDQRYSQITTKSLKADYPIAINFIGENAGVINVRSASDLILKDSVTNVAGPVTLCAGGLDCNALSGSASIIVAKDVAQVKGNVIVLNAAGSVGGVTYARDPAATPLAPVRLEFASGLTGIGSLTSHAGNGVVSIISRGDIRVDQITAGGDATDRATQRGAVSLIASGNIVAAHPAAIIQAPRVSLDAGGVIGSVVSGKQLLVNTGYSRGVSLREFGDPALVPALNQNPYFGLKALASGDIGITSTAWAGNVDGSMLINQVLSTGGDVRLSSPGQILDNLPVERVDARTYAELLNYWDSLGLVEASATATGTENVNKQLAAVRAYENSKTQNYDEYWRIRQTQADGGAAYDATFTVDVVPGTAQYNALTRQFEADIRASNPGFTDVQVDAAVAQKLNDFEVQQTSEYHELHAEVGGFTASFDDNYRYAASTKEQSDMTKGAVWTERELAFSLAPGVLKTVTATNTVVKDPNVSGRSVTLEAGVGIGETIGAGTANVGVQIRANIDPRNLTSAQKVALAAAERSDLMLTLGPVVLPTSATADQVDAYNKAVGFGLHLPGALTSVAIGKDYALLTPVEQAAYDAAALHLVPAADTLITILSKRPLNFDVDTALNVRVTAPIADTSADVGIAYLASQNYAPLGIVLVPGETRIKVIRDISNSSLGSLVTTGNLILEAAQGGIAVGTDPVTLTAYNPLSLSLRTGATLTARAQTGININMTGDALIDTIYSRQDIALSAAGSILNTNDDLLVNVLGDNVTLTARTGSIGSITRALNVNSGSAGGISAQAAGAVNLYGPSLNPFIIKSAVAGTSIKLDSGFDSIINGPVTATGTINFIAGGRQIFTANANVHSTIGDVDMRAKSLKILNGARVSADLGRIFVETDEDAVITGLVSGSNDRKAVSVVAGGRVFAGTLPGRVDIEAMAPGAGVFIKAALGIGDKTQANDNYVDGPGSVAGSAHAITNTANPLRVLSAILDFNTTVGDLYVHTLGNVTDATLLADAGHLDVLGDGDFVGTLLGGTTMRIRVAGHLTLKDIQVAKSLALEGGSIDANITQSPSGPDPLLLTLTGIGGGVGNVANLNVNAPAGLVFDNLRFTDTNLQTTARSVSLLKAFVPGTLLLTTPLQTLLFDNRTPLPQAGNTVQLHQPGFAFMLDLKDFHTVSDAFVVRYDTSAQVTNVLTGLPFRGISLVRDTIRVLRGGEAIDLFDLFAALKDEGAEDLQIEVAGTRLIINGIEYPIVTLGVGAAVQLSQR